MGPKSKNGHVTEEVCDAIMDGVRSLLENEIDIVIAEAKLQLEKKKPEILARVSLHIMDSIRIEKINRDLVIYISMGEK